VLVVKIQDGIIMRHPFRRVSKSPGVAAGQASWVSRLGKQALLRAGLGQSYQEAIEFVKLQHAGIETKELGSDENRASRRVLMHRWHPSEFEEWRLAEWALKPLETWVIHKPITSMASLVFYIQLDKPEASECVCSYVEISTSKSRDALVAELADFPSESEIANSLN
jgi:hypothetical protein